MIFASPHFLWLMVLPPLLTWVGWRVGAGRPRRNLTAFLRAVCLASVILALARPLIVTSTASWTHVLVVDLSPTMPAASLMDVVQRYQKSEAPNVQVIAFSNRAERLANPLLLNDPSQLAALCNRVRLPVADDDLKEGGAVLAGALQLAGAQIPPGGRGDVELVSNGLVSRGDAEAQAYRLAQRGISVRVVSAPAVFQASPPAVIRRVSLPASAAVGQTVNVDVEIESDVAERALVSLAVPGAAQISVEAVLVKGEQSVRLLLPLRSVGLTPVTVELSVKGKSLGGAFPGAIQVMSPPRLLFVGDESAQPTVAALSGILGRGVAIEKVSPGEVSARSLDEYAAIVVADVPADVLSAEAQDAIRKAVHNGAGLLVTGAAHSFGPGGYDSSALEPLLPVRMPQQAESIDPSTTLVLIIDTSGSMEEFQRIDLAKEIAQLAISHLKPHDKVGIVEFYGGKRWAAPIQSAANSAVIKRALGRLTAGGGTTLYPAVEEAAFTLGSVDTQSKHVLIISDGGVESAPFATLLRQMNEDGVAVSSVAVAPTPGQPNLMPDLALWGGGRFYAVPDRFALPDITLKKPHMSLLSPVVRRPTKLVGVNDSLIRADAVSGWPAINGYVRTVARPTADVILRTSAGDPILARWRYGAGFVSTLTTQLGSAMTRGLQDEPAFTQLIAGLLRQMETAHQSLLEIHPTVRPAGLEVSVTAPDSGGSVATGTLQVKLADEQGRLMREAEAEPLGSGKWNILLPGVSAGTYSLDAIVLGTASHGSAAAAVVGPRAVPRLTADTDLLSRLGAFGSLAAERLVRLPPTAEKIVELSPLLVTLCVAAFVGEVAARRWRGQGK